MNGFTPNNNKNVIRLLSEEIRKCNKSRNRILMGAVILCILTLTFVFGTAYGKINAEYTKNIRMDGTAASTYIEEGTRKQYEKVRSLGYVKETGRRLKIAEAAKSGEKKSICSVFLLFHFCHIRIFNLYPAVFFQPFIPFLIFRSLFIIHYPLPPSESVQAFYNIAFSLFLLTTSVLLRSLQTSALQSSASERSVSTVHRNGQ